jgi:ABC-type transporter Mla maintaining outer membrane lipid asymmetry ATPase subunit MlaF
MLRCEHPWVKSYFRGQRGRLLEHQNPHAQA